MIQKYKMMYNINNKKSTWHTEDAQWLLVILLFADTSSDCFIKAFSLSQGAILFSLPFCSYSPGRLLQALLNPITPVPKTVGAGLILSVRIHIQEGTLKPQKYLLKDRPLTDFLPSECSRNPSASVYQLVSWEGAFGFSEFFLRTLSMLLPISWGVIYKHAKNSMSAMPYPPYSIYLALSNFVCFPEWKKFLRGKHFADVEEVKKKMAEAW